MGIKVALEHRRRWPQDAFGNSLAQLVFPNRARSLTVTVALIAELKVIAGVPGILDLRRVRTVLH